MSKGARIKRAVVFTVSAAFAATMLTGCSQGGGDSAAGGDVTLEFAQWWEPELSDGALRGLMDDFEAANPGITVDLLSGPYASTKEQLFAGAAAGTMSDVERSEERRVGKECRLLCRSRWSPYH